ncbi:replication initiator [Herbidospora sp. NBRC 101105]|uniref:replication initiator n=1 Tax=Herbidospora sp. NBRC 101105 TaxID=3032195 RepID=UPI0024A467A3|nr:replication initiator [Herbidospora sp. NBRC 101105]GLX96771.1 hypothetical protein Hesp01_47210 [Herbidospora sp. NBRC 101105]
MTDLTDRHTPRAIKQAMPLAHEVVEALAIDNGVCIRPVGLRRMDLKTGISDIINAPCGSTMEAKCPPCAKRNRALRMAQCREGWHLTAEPAITRDEPNDYQRHLVEWRADAQALRDQLESAGLPTDDYDQAIAKLDAEINAAGVRGNVLGRTASKRSRSTRRRQDAPDLPKRAMTATTLGRTYTGTDGRTYRPSMFITLTLDTYGRVNGGVAVDPATYDYVKAARDALHFSKLIDRFVQNLRRVAGYDVQYFASVEMQKRLAPHLHMAMRGSMSRADIRAVAAATYHQVWWPSCETVRFEGGHLPVWDEKAGYLDPDSGEILPTWDEALDQLDADPDAQPLHVVRFGAQVDAQGILSGTPDADQAIRYVSKYLTKSLGQAADSQAARDHADRLLEVLRYEPCTPTCPNWLRYGVQPKNAKPGMIPGRCRAKAHKPEHLGYGGRRVLVSRKWSNKTLTEHKADRRTWVLEALGITDEPADVGRYVWSPVKAGDPDLPPIRVRLLRSIRERLRWRAHLNQLQAAADGQDLSTGERSAA